MNRKMKAAQHKDILEEKCEPEWTQAQTGELLGRQ